MIFYINVIMYLLLATDFDIRSSIARHFFLHFFSHCLMIFQGGASKKQLQNFEKTSNMANGMISSTQIRPQSK